MPITVVILVGIFAIQQHGTRPGRPALRSGDGAVVRRASRILGLRWIVAGAGGALARSIPRHGVDVLPTTHGFHGFAVLGAVFLAVTGGEALYADMGHFGKRPIRLAWFALVLPALLLNYFGQGALLLLDAPAAEQPVLPAGAGVGAAAAGRRWRRRRRSSPRRR